MCNVFIPKYLVSLFKDEIIEIKDALLKTISMDYKLDYEELKSKYIIYFNIVANDEEKLQIVKKHKYNNKKKDKSCNCFAYSSTGNQCQRSKLQGEQFCHIHLHNTRYGTLGIGFKDIRTKPKKQTKYY